MPNEKAEIQNINEKSEDISKKEKEEKDRKLTQINKAQYTPKQIKNADQEEVKVSTERSKIIERRTYKNGVVKSRLVGILKKGKVIYNAGLEKKWLNPNKNALKK